jgi:hypothetical protein
MPANVGAAPLVPRVILVLIRVVAPPCGMPCAAVAVIRPAAPSGAGWYRAGA